eukprot:1934596-Pyramimonas_sp.AAC.1
MAQRLAGERRRRDTRSVSGAAAAGDSSAEAATSTATSAAPTQASQGPPASDQLASGAEVKQGADKICIPQPPQAGTGASKVPGA